MKYFTFSKNPSCKQDWLCAKITGVRTEIFQGKVGFVELGHFDKHFVKNTRKKKGPQGKIFEFYHLDTVKNYILDKKFKPKMDTIRAFFFKLRPLFSIFKKGKGRPPTLVARLNN